MDGIGAIGAEAGVSDRPSAFSELKSEEFVRIIFTELANQDPLAPSDSKALLDQLSSLRSIQSDIDMGRRLSDLVTQNELSSAAGLIGKTVRGRGATGSVTGPVESVTRSDQGTVLNLGGGRRILMSRVEEVFDEGGGA